MSAEVVTTKKCRTCGDVLALSLFYNLKRGKQGVFPDCKRCKVEAKRSPNPTGRPPGNGKSGAPDAQTMMGRISDDDFTEIFDAFIKRAKRGDAQAQAWIINKWAQMQEASGEAMMADAVNPAQVRKALVALMREYVKGKDYHERAQRLLAAVAERGPDAALEEFGGEV